MKTLKSIILGLAMLAVCGAAKATENNNADRLSKTYVINTFVDAITRGNLSGLNEVLDQSAEFSSLRNNQVLSYTKKQMLDYLQTNKGVEQVCTTSTSVVESNADMSLVKVDMKYDLFVKSTYVTLINTGNGWKITNVYSVIK